MLDNTSFQILKALTKDGRYSFTKLAKELKIKPSTVSSKVNKMLEDDLISIQAVPNPFKIGYKFQVVIALNVSLNHIDAVCDALMDNPYISSIAVMYGRFDILILAEFPDTDKLNKLVRGEMPYIDGVYRIDTFFISERKKSYERIFSPDSLVDDPVHIDTIDENLISELRKNGRANLNQLATKYSISTASVTRRVANLIKKDIMKITVVPNHTKLLGFTAVAYLIIDAEARKVNDICEQLSVFPEVHSVMTLINRYNILAILVLSDHDALHKFITNKVSLINGVNEVETLIRAELKKRTYVYIDESQFLSSQQNTPGT